MGDAVDVTLEQFDFGVNLFKVPDRFVPYVDSVILPEGLLMNRW